MCVCGGREMYVHRVCTWGAMYVLIALDCECVLRREIAHVNMKPGGMTSPLRCGTSQ